MAFSRELGASRPYEAVAGPAEASPIRETRAERGRARELVQRETVRPFRASRCL